MGKSKSIVRIAGREYTIVSEDSKEHVYRVALYVDEKLSHLNQEHVELSTAQLMALAIMNIGDDYIKQLDKSEHYRRAIEDLKNKLTEMEIGSSLSGSNSTINRLKNRIAELEQQSTQQTELEDTIELLQMENEELKQKIDMLRKQKGYNKYNR